MGVVYKAWHRQLDRPGALKVLPKDRLGHAEAVARFRREMKALGRLDHPHLVTAHDAGEENGVPYLAMELVDGLDASQVVARLGPLPVADACELVRQAAEGLEYAAQQGIIHRDVKPSNLMLTSSGAVKVLDLGLAKLIDRPVEEEISQTSQILGTIEYMAPERLNHSDEDDSRADVYSLGATLYKLLTGRTPFSGPRHRTPLQKLAAVAQGSLPPAQTLRADLPPELADLVGRILARDRAARLATSGEVAKALEPFVVGSDLRNVYERACAVPSQADAAAVAQEVSPAVSLAPTDSMHTAATRQRRARVQRRWLALAAGSAASIVLLGILLTVSTGKGTVQLEFADAEAARQCAISIDGDEIRVENLGEPIKLRPGKHELRLTHGELEIETREFTVLRRGNQILHVSIPRLPRDAGLAKAAAPARKSSIRWLGYTVRNHPTKSIAEIAEYTNIVFDHGWPTYGDELIKAARMAELRVVLMFHDKAEKELFLKQGMVMARNNQDVVQAVCWSDPYGSGFQAGDLITFRRTLEERIPGMQLWATFWASFWADAPAKAKLFPVPPCVDVLLIELGGVNLPHQVRATASTAFPYWREKASGRPVLLYWSGWLYRPQSLVHFTDPGTMYTCAQCAEEHGLAGVIFDDYGTETEDRRQRTNPDGWVVGLQTRPQLVAEIKRIAHDVGVGKPSFVSGEPVGLDHKLDPNHLGIVDYSEVIRHEPKAADPYLHRGAAYATQGDLREALMDFRQAVRLKADAPPSWSRWVCCWLPAMMRPADKLPGIVFVSEMPWVRSTGYAGRCNPPGEGMAIDGLPYARGVYNHRFDDARPVDVVLDIAEQKFAAFKVHAGLTFNTGGTIQFQVLVDGKVKHETPVIRRDGMQAISVDVAGAKEVVLRVLNGGDGNNGDCAGWGFARFVKAGAEDPLEVPPAEIRTATETNAAFFLAEVHCRLNQKELARRWYNTAAAWMDKHPAEAEGLRPLRAEAAKVLSIPDAGRAGEAPSPPATAQDFANRGRTHHDRGEIAQAIAAYSEAIRLEPNVAQHYLGRGQAYASYAEVHRAIADFSEAIRLDPDNFDAHVSRALVFSRNKADSAKAAADLQAAVRIRPDCARDFMRKWRFYQHADQVTPGIAEKDKFYLVVRHFAQPGIPRSALGKPETGAVDGARWPAPKAATEDRERSRLALVGILLAANRHARSGRATGHRFRVRCAMGALHFRVRHA